jgi:hypothetical protein
MATSPRLLHIFHLQTRVTNAVPRHSRYNVGWLCVLHGGWIPWISTSRRKQAVIGLLGNEENCSNQSVKTPHARSVLRTVNTSSRHRQFWRTGFLPTNARLFAHINHVMNQKSVIYLLPQRKTQKADTPVCILFQLYFYIKELYETWNRLGQQTNNGCPITWRPKEKFSVFRYWSNRRNK